MRFKDILLILGAVGGLVLGLGKVFILADAVEKNVKKLEMLEPRIALHETRIAINDERWAQIQDDIRSIKIQLARNSRHQ